MFDSDGQEEGVQREPRLGLPGLGSHLRQFDQRLRQRGSRAEMEQVMLNAIGWYSKQVRKSKEVSRESMADMLSMSSEDLQAFEVGLMPLEDMPDGFMCLYFDRLDAGHKLIELEQEVERMFHYRMPAPLTGVQHHG